jgi:signal transduction histidine kinase
MSHVPPGWARQLASVPLLQKLVVADLIINIGAFVAVQRAPIGLAAEITVAALLATLVLNAALVVWALRPLRKLEETAARVTHGDLDARVASSPLADRNIVRIGTALNELLDAVTADRRRLRQLAAQVISAGDEERAHIARELHDSTAQSLSALEFMLTASLRDAAAAPVHDRLRLMHEVTREALAEVRALSHNVHPRVLDDLGLAAALEFLARRTRETTEARVHVTSDVRAPVPPSVASVVYRVAQEAVRNAVRHAAPRDVHLTVVADADRVTLEVADDGRGFDVDRTFGERRGMGLFVMRERVALVDGTLDVASRPGGGSRVRAEIPIPSPVAAAPTREAAHAREAAS